MEFDGNSITHDTELVIRVDSVIRNCGRPEMRRVSIQAENGCVILRGEVATYYAKQVAQTLAQAVDGVSSIRNQIDVQHMMFSNLPVSVRHPMSDLRPD